MRDKKHSNVNFAIKLFSLKIDMNKHITSVHEDKKPFKCGLCNYYCSKKSSMYQHVAVVHEGKNHSNVKFVTTVALENLRLNNMLNQFMKERNH